MIIKPDEEFRQKLISDIANREFRVRSGVHSSDLIYCLNKQALRKVLDDKPTEDEVLIYSVGWASQRWLTGTFDPDTEYTLDGITVTPDMEYAGSPWELKATYASSSKDIMEQTHWIRQIMAQCKVTGTTTARLSRLELMGDWKMNPPKDWAEAHPKEPYIWKHPTLSAYYLEFTPEEVDLNWAWMRLRHSLFLPLWGMLENSPQIMWSDILVPRVSALAPGQTWECGYCKYKNKECPYGNGDKPSDSESNV